ncbi:hypothetical protein DNI29_03455 [Hymenobacter sediminis]|uniref:hypothetical protein n=1 Tax=Hymenobacter sediminis TaxID=2218621 RepID=UPI000DA6A861|nr:hypothetical protein [Hymenobacter sediminis]RPD49867.1 hypothetical protein DNI29_03455 [Hymenobacter sediminis]
MPDVVDFFTSRCADGSLSDDVTNAAEFGLCDDPHVAGQPKKRAYVDEHDSEKWIARVINHPRYEVTFKGVDNCIIVERPATGQQVEKESSCDGILLYEENIIFVELKDKKRDWLKGAVEQVQATITAFKVSHDIENYKMRRAYVVNKAQPQFNAGRNQRANSFFAETGIVLRPEATIDLTPLL